MMIFSFYICLWLRARLGSLHGLFVSTLGGPVKGGSGDLRREALEVFGEVLDSAEDGHFEVPLAKPTRPPSKARPAACAVPSCGRSVWGGGLCIEHYLDGLLEVVGGRLRRAEGRLDRVAAAYGHVDDGSAKFAYRHDLYPWRKAAEMGLEPWTEELVKELRLDDELLAETANDDGDDLGPWE
jgi:hypothetical protein